MKKMKRFLVALLSCLTACACVAGLSACKEDEKKPAPAPESSVAESVVSSEEEAVSSEEAPVVSEEEPVSSEEAPVVSEDPVSSEETPDSSVEDDNKVPAHEHVYGEWVVEIEATCARKGLQTHYCTFTYGEGLTCTAEESEPISALEHTEKVIEGYAATCTEAGLSDGSYCEVCNATINPQEVIVAAGHNYVDVAAKAATCEEDGNEAGIVCSVCGDVKVDPVVIPALDHDNAVPATCYSVAHCSRCDQDYGDVADHLYITTKAVFATCTKEGKPETDTCVYCGDEIVATVSAEEYAKYFKAGHEVDYTTADCTTGAICTVCDEVVTEPGKHIWTKVAKQTANYDQCGWDEFKVCLGCTPDEFVDGDTLDMAAFLAEFVEVDEKTGRETANLKEFEGAIEGFKYYMSLCVEHDWDETKASYVIGVDATCTEAGKTYGGECVRCGKKVASKVIPAKGHVELDPATCSTKATCAICEDEDGNPLEYGNVLGHDTERRAAKAATCTTPGYKAYEVCTREGCDYTTFEYIEATNPDHDDYKTTMWTVVTYKAAKCGVEGNATYLKCKKCDYIATVDVDEKNVAVKEDGEYVGVAETTIADITLAALEHDWDTEKANYKEAQLPTCTEAGWTFGGTCKICKKTITSTTVAKLGHDGSRKYTIVENEDGVDVVVPVTADMKNENGFLDDASSKATCVANAYCGFCGELEDTQIVDKNGDPKHAYKVVKAASPTCVATGNVEYYVCTNGCDSIWTKSIEAGKTVYTEVNLVDVTIDAVGHSMITVEAVAPTCTTKGCAEYTKCEYCALTNYSDGLIIDEVAHANAALANGETTCAQHVVCDHAWSVWTDANEDGVEDEDEITWYGCGAYVVEVEEAQKAEHTWSAELGECLVCGTECTHPGYTTIEDMDVCTQCGKEKQN